MSETQDAWLLRVLDLKVERGNGTIPPPPPPPGGNAPRQEKTSARPGRRAQRIVWQAPDLTYGAVLSDVPEAVVAEGNQDAAPRYVPPRGATVLAAGTHDLAVFVAGNDVWLDAQQPLTLRIDPRPLTVTVLAASIAEGESKPTLRYQADRLVSPDAIAVAFAHADPSHAPVGQRLPVTASVTFTRGDARNYAITVVPGTLEVTESYEAMDQKITALRHDMLDHKRKLLDELDQVKLLRDDRDNDPLALSRALAALRPRVDFVAVEKVVLTAASGTKLKAADTTLALTAALTPANPTDPALSWAPSRPDLVSVSPAGLVTRLGPAGGKVVVTATAAGVDQGDNPVLGPLEIEVETKPETILIAPPAQIRFDDPVKLRASVDPPDAPQDVRWKTTGNRPRNVALSADGTVTVTAPTTSGGSSGGKITVVASAEADPSVTETIAITFGGYVASDIRLTTAPRGGTVTIGQEIEIRADVVPDKAEQKVEFTLDDPSIATLSDVADATAKLKITGGGTIVLRARAAGAGKGGTDIESTRSFTAQAAITDIAIAVPPALTIDQTAPIPVTFTPKESRAGIIWSVDPADMAEVARGTLRPLRAGTKIARSAGVTITAPATAQVAIGQWDVIRPILERFARAIHIFDHPPVEEAYGRYTYNLRRRAEQGTVVTLGQVRGELIALRNNSWILNHAEWLEKSGFGSSNGGTYIRNDTQIPVGGQSFPIHLTMFANGESRPMGNNAVTLLDWMIQRNAAMLSMHATLTARPGGGHEVKQFISGAVWTASPVFRNAWAVPAVQLDQAARNWLTARETDVDNALQAYVNGIRADDGTAMG
ncbi:MAG: hypothetical protein KGI51_10580 [Rhodospirillales bacterium]|nr:hypothetical protein [Rhodospirillales bacterium]